MSVNPQVLRDTIQFYLTIMMGESPLSRVQREMLATVNGPGSPSFSICRPSESYQNHWINPLSSAS